MTKINYKSDFDFIMRLRDCKDPEKTVEWPEGDFEAVFWAGSKANPYRAGRRGGVCENCFPTEDGGMHFVFDKHRLGVGTLKWEPHFELANVIYPDGKEDVYSKEPLGIELVDGPGDCPTTAEVEALVPFIRFKYEDLTDEEKAEISKPATDAAASVRELEKSVRAAEELRVANETARIGAENARELAEQTRQANEQDRTEAEALREVAEEERNDAEERRAEEFAGWEGEIDSKADRSELSNVLAEEPLDAGNFPGINTYTREELKKDLFIDYWNASCVYCDFNRIVDRFGEYVEESDLFELCGTLLTYEEALEVAPMFTREIMATYMENKYCNLMVRAIPAVPCSSWGCSYKHTFAASIKLERIRFSAKTAGGLVRITDGSMMFLACSALKVIEGTLYINANTNTASMFEQCVKLREVRIITLNSLSLKDSPELSDESIAYLINHREGSKAITVTLHPTAYARVTDELFETAASKNITIASA